PIGTENRPYRVWFRKRKFWLGELLAAFEHGDDALDPASSRLWALRILDAKVDRELALLVEGVEESGCLGTLVERFEKVGLWLHGCRALVGASPAAVCAGFLDLREPARG